MTQVIVTVQYENKEPLDLSLPWELPVGEFIEPVANVFNVRRTADSTLGLVRLINSSRDHISLEETLADANIMYGDILELKVYGHPYLFSSAGKRFPLARDIVVIGRVTPRQAVDIDLSKLDLERVISRKHAVIIRRGEDYFIKDTNSSNGVYVNNRKITPGQLRKLANGDLLQLGGPHGVELLFGIRNQG